LGIEKCEGNLIVCCSEHYKLENSASVAQNVYSREITEQNHVQSIHISFTPRFRQLNYKQILNGSDDGV
jgi:hypothetical protein